MFSRTAIDVRTGDGRNFELLTPFTFTTAAGVVHEVPAGSTSDGASTPRELWPTLPPFGSYWLAAFLHDWAYRFSDLGKDECDALLLEAMHCQGVSAFIAAEIYQGVHLFGQGSFSADRAMRAASVARATATPIAVPTL